MTNSCVFTIYTPVSTSTSTNTSATEDTWGMVSFWFSLGRQMYTVEGEIYEMMKSEGG